MIGGWLSGYLQSHYTINGVFIYSNFWYTLSVIGLLATIAFYFSFKEQTE